MSERTNEGDELQQWLDTLRLFDPMHAAMFEYGRRIGRTAAEAQVAHYREALERIAETSFGSEWVALREIRRIAREAAALAPDTEGEGT